MEGTIRFAGLCSEWPPLEKQTYRRKPLTLEILNDGSFRILLDNLGQGTREFTSRRVFVGGPGLRRWIVSVGWSDDEIDLWVNGAKVGSSEEHSVLTVDGKVEDVEPTYSFDDASVDICCAGSLQKRKSFEAKTWSKLYPGDRAHTNGELRAFLANAADDLRRSLQVVRSGGSGELSRIAVTLRGLLYWDENKPDKQSPYKPLLLRVAAQNDLSLPIYAMPVDPVVAPMVDGVQLLAGPFGVRRAISRQRLLDVQEWLLDEAFLPGSQTAVFGGARTFLTLINSVANTLGSAHWGSGRPPALDLIQSFQIKNEDGLGYLMVMIAEMVLDLCDRVLLILEVRDSSAVRKLSPKSRR